MNTGFWINKWQEGDIRFHQSKYHPLLEKFGPKFTRGTILVPLCGKSLDMLYLVSQGHKVIGVELSIIACRDFFTENNIPVTEKEIDDFVVFDSERITLWCGDFFKIPQTVWNKISGIYDRAALVALPEDMRQKYAKEMSKGSKRVEILLISFDYSEGALQGPPFSVPETEVRKIYSLFETENICTEKSERLGKDNPKLQSIEVTETVYWLQRN